MALRDRSGAPCPEAHRFHVRTRRDTYARRRAGVDERADKGLELLACPEELAGGRDLRRAAASGAEVEHAEETVRRMRRERLPGLHDAAGVGPRPLDRVRRDAVDGMRAEDESRDDPEVAAAAASARPVQIGVLARVADERLPGGSDDRRLDEVVAGQAELACGEADAPAECEPCDPDGRTCSRRHGDAALPELVVDVDQPCAGADRRTLARVERNLVQPRDVDDDTGGRRVAAVAVTARARHDAHGVLARPAHGALHVLPRLAEDDGPRMHSVEARVVEDAGTVVRRVARHDHVALERARELAVDAARRRRQDSRRRTGAPSGRGRRGRPVRAAPGGSERPRPESSCADLYGCPHHRTPVHRAVRGPQAGQAGPMLDVLEKLPLLHGLKRARLSELALAGTIREYKPADVVVEAGEYADSVHVILAGQAGVNGQPAGGDAGARRLLRRDGAARRRRSFGDSLCRRKPAHARAAPQRVHLPAAAGARDRDGADRRAVLARAPARSGAAPASPCPAWPLRAGRCLVSA